MAERSDVVPNEGGPIDAGDPFYVDRNTCLSCGIPIHEAPDLLEFRKRSPGGDCGESCAFKKQPSTPEEVERAIRAMSVSCVGALRYAGHDPSVLARLCELRLRHQCDQLASFERLPVRYTLMPARRRWLRDLLRLWKSK